MTVSHTLGKDCNLILNHASVNGGADVGFLLQPDPRSVNAGPVVQLQREIQSDGSSVSKVYFTVLLAGMLVNPDGTVHAESRSTMYAFLTLFLQQPGAVTLGFASGFIPNLAALGHVSTEMHYGDFSLVSCQFTDNAIYFAPADPVAFYASAWDGALTWSTSYWR